MESIRGAYSQSSGTTVLTVVGPESPSLRLILRLCQHSLLLFCEYSSLVEVLNLRLRASMNGSLRKRDKKRTQLFAQFFSYVFFVSAHAFPSSPGLMTLAPSRQAKYASRLSQHCWRSFLEVGSGPSDFPNHPMTQKSRRV